MKTENRERRTENREQKTDFRSPFSALRFPLSVLRFCLPFLFSVLCSLSFAHAADSLSDLALEQFEKGGVATGARNPFAPSDVSGKIDIESLSLEGLLIGKSLKLGLVSGKIVKEGDKIGLYLVKEILPGEIILLTDSEEHHLKVDGYLPSFKQAGGLGFWIEFRNADIRDALKLLSKAEDLNLIVPEDLSGRVNLSFSNISLRNAMRAILKVNSYSYAIENGVMRVGKPDEFLGGTDLLATTFSLKYAKAKDLLDQIKPLLSDKGSVAAEERMNIISVKDYDANIDSVRQLIEKVDAKDQQVSIEAHIIDATSDFSRSLGVQWGASANPTKVLISGGDSTGTIKIGTNTPTPAHVNLGATTPTSAAAFRIGQLPGITNIDLQLSAAEEKGDIRILSKPSVTTINNAPASIKSGLTLYVKSNSDINVGTSGGSSTASSSNLQAIKTGIQLEVTPQITPNDYIKLTIEANESEADFSRTVDGIPSIIDNTASTTVILKDGETAVIGGLIKRKDTLKKRSVPGFSKVPVVGLFFKNKTTAKTQNELMVFITPRILK